MARSAAGTALPPDHEFSPRTDTAAADAAWTANKLADPLAGSIIQKILHWESKAQKMANDNTCAVLCHWIDVPHFQNTPPTIMAVLVPSNEAATEPT